MREKEFKEGLGDLAHRAEMDHEVQMARADLYKMAKYSIKLHDMLKNISEAEGIEGWVAAKITKAADYLGSVYHHLDYEQASANEDAVTESKTEASCGCDAKSCSHCGGKHTLDEVGQKCECCGNMIKEVTTEGRMSDQIIGDSETMSKEEFAKKYGKEMADEYYESVSEGKSPHKKGTKKYKKHMAAMHAGMGESLEQRLAAKLESKKKISELQKTGSAGQAKGKDPMPKTSTPSRSGEQKHPLKDKLVGEKAPPGREKQVKKLKKKFDDPGAPYAIAWAQHNKHGKPKKKTETTITPKDIMAKSFKAKKIQPKKGTTADAR